MNAKIRYNYGMGNTGHHNIGDCNSGTHNIGKQNEGCFNHGDRNIGHSNIGDSNLGCYNKGSCNVGSDNIGNYNEGDFNIGFFNTGILNLGAFCTDRKANAKLFNKESDWDIKQLEESKAMRIMAFCPARKDLYYVSKYDMTEEEKEMHPEYTTMGGYLRTISATNKDRQEWWDNLPEEDKAEVMSLPNFDKDIFKECTGIEV